MNKVRELSKEQHTRLTDVAKSYPTAYVIGWYSDNKGRYGPVVWFPQQSARRFVNYTGRLVKVAA